jgi:hypothetical protein
LYLRGSKHYRPRWGDWCRRFLVHEEADSLRETHIYLHALTHMDKQNYNKASSPGTSLAAGVTIVGRWDDSCIPKFGKNFLSFVKHRLRSSPEPINGQQTCCHHSRLLRERRKSIALLPYTHLLRPRLENLASESIDRLNGLYLKRLPPNTHISMHMCASTSPQLLIVVPAKVHDHEVRNVLIN